MEEEKIVNQLVSSTKSSLSSRPTSVQSSFRVEPAVGNNSTVNIPNKPSVIQTGTVETIDLNTTTTNAAAILDDVELSEVSLRSSNISDAKDADNLQGKNIAYFIFLFLGIGSLLPWNAFITSASYYQLRFCGTPYENSFESFFSMFYTVSGPIGLWITILFQDHLPIRSLVLYPLIIYTGIFCMITIFVVITSFEADALFGITLVSLGACGVCSALMNGGLFGLSGLLPSIYTGAIMNGQGIAGFGVSAVNLLILSATSTPRYCNDDDGGTNDDGECNYSISYGALAFYIASSVTLFLCIIFFLILLKLEYVAYYIKLYYKERVEILRRKSQATVENPLHPLQMAMQPVDRSSGMYDFSARSSTNYSGMHSITSNSGGEGIPQKSSNSPITSPASSTLNPTEKYGKHSSANRNIFSPDMITALIEDIGKKETTTGEEDPRGRNSSSPIASRGSNSTTNSNYPTKTINANAQTGPTSTNSPHNTHTHQHQHDPNLSMSRSTLIPDPAQTSMALSPRSIFRSNRSEIFETLEKVRVPAYAVFITFCGTLTVFPTIMVLIQSQSSCNAKYNSLFVSILFTIFNLCDFVGRNSAIYVYPYRSWIHEKNIWMYANLRLVIPFLICFCNISDSQLPVWFSYDVIAILLLASLGLSNGLLANLAMMYGPTVVESENAALAGTIMVFCLSMGLLIGSCLSFFVYYIVTGG